MQYIMQIICKSRDRAPLGTVLFGIILKKDIPLTFPSARGITMCSAKGNRPQWRLEPHSAHTSASAEVDGG